MTPQRQKQVLIGLLVLLGVFAVRAFLKVSGSGSPRKGRRPSVSRPAPRRAATAENAPPRIVDLHLSDLEQKPGEFEPGRDPFRFQPKPRPKPAAAPPPPPPPAPKRRRSRPPPQRTAAAAKPQPPEPTFLFLGSFGPEKRRVAVFSDRTEIYNVLEGDVFMEAFVVRKIGYESADIGWVDFPDEPVRRLAAGG